MTDETAELSIDFMTDDDVERMIDSLDHFTPPDTPKYGQTDPRKLQYMLYTYRLLRYVTKDVPDTEVTYQPYTPAPTIGFVSLVGSSVPFSHPAWLTKAVALADNFDVSSRLDGTVQMDFVFHHLLYWPD